MAGNLVKSVMLKIVASDGDSEAKLDRISAKADELAKKHPDIKVKIDTAAASAKLAVLKGELRDTAKEADKSKFSLKGFGLALASVASGGLSGGIKDMSMMQKVMLGLNAATGLAEPLLAGLTVVVGGLSAGLVAGGLGLGAFGLVAKTVWTQAATAATAYGAAQQKLALATTSAQRTSALQAEKAALFGLSPPVKTLSMEIGNVQGEWKKFTNAAAPGVVGVISQGLGILPKTFKYLAQFLGPAETAISGLLGSLNKGLSSGGFKSWISSFAAASGPMITNLGHAIGHIVVGIGGILRAFLPMASRMTGGLDNITAKFAKWGTTLSGHSGFQSLMSMFKTETPLAVGVLKNLVGVVKNVVAAMTGLSTFSNGKILLQILGPLSGILNKLTQNKGLVNFALYALAAGDALKRMSSGITAVSNGFTAIKGAGSVIQGLAVKLGILKAAQTEAAVATEGETVAQTELDGAMDANPIGLIILAVAGLVIGIVELWKHSTGFRNFWKGAWKDIKGAAVDAWHFIDNDMIHPLMHGIDALVSFVRGHWRLLATIIATVLLGPVGGLVAFIATNWSKIKSLTSRLVTDVTGFFKRLPGDILSALGNLGSILLNAGESIMRGFLSGLESGWHAVTSFIGGIGSWIASHKGPISADRVLLVPHGQAIVSGLMAGMTSRMPALTQLAGGIAGTASAAASRGVSGGGGPGGRVTVEIHAPPGSGYLPPEFWTQLGNGIRVRGGDPRILQRKVVLA